MINDLQVTGMTGGRLRIEGVADADVVEYVVQVAPGIPPADDAEPTGSVSIVRNSPFSIEVDGLSFGQYEVFVNDVILPAISGVAYPGETLTAPPLLEDIQWYVDGQPVSGETGETYVVKVGDIGLAIECRSQGNAVAGVMCWHPADESDNIVVFLPDVNAMSSVSPDVPAANGESVARWSDEAEVHVVNQPDSTKRPVMRLSEVNENSTLQFDGSNDSLVASGASTLDLFRNASTGYLIAAISDTNRSGGNPSHCVAGWSIGAAGVTRMALFTRLNGMFAASTRMRDADNLVSASSAGSDGYFVLTNECLWSQGAINLRRDGQVVATASLPRFGITSDTRSGIAEVGSLNQSEFSGHIACLIAVSGNVSGAARNRLERYAGLLVGKTVGSPPAGSPEGEYNVFLVAGQSNTDGWVSQSLGPAWINDGIVDGVKTWTGSEVMDYDLSNYGATGNGANWAYFGKGGYSFAHVALKAVAEHLPNVLTVQVTNGGALLSGGVSKTSGSFSADYESIPSDTPKLLEALENRVMSLRSWAAERGVALNFRGVLWHQGEADHQASKSGEYAANFSAMVAKVREFTQTPDLPIFYGTVASASSAYNATISQSSLDYATGDENAYCRDNSELGLFDGIHFSATACNTFGEWTATQVLSHLGVS